MEESKEYAWLREMERKWQKKWEEAKVFETDPVENKPKFFITFPYPYVNGAPHLGHTFSSMRVDSYARFKRLLGFNVLFPQGFHATGEPILGVQERLNKNDEIQIKTMKLYGATDEDIEKFKKDAKYIVEFWVNRWINDLKLAGFSIDWRRTFVTAIDDHYHRFVTWQYKKLKEKDYIKQGKHPVIWCPHCQSPTGDHDRLKGEGETPVEFSIIKFRFDDDIVFPVATLRPETIVGVTNAWINPNGKYVLAEVNGEKWIVSEDAIKKLEDQLKIVHVIKEIDPKSLIGKKVHVPLIEKDVPILPSEIVDTDFGTGCVMSVPGHAPYDYIAFIEAKKDPELSKYLEGIKPVSIIKLEGYSDLPAKDAIEKHEIKSSSEDEKLEDATNEIYKKEFHVGVMKDNVPFLAGLKVSDAKEKVKELLQEKKAYDTMWETSGIVICRCTTKCHVKILENQWFIDYSNPEWKAKVKEWISKMKFYPEEIRKLFFDTVDWLKEKACTRKTGLGTRFPFDKEWIIEPLSDSTIYMSYYIIQKYIAKHGIKAGQMTDEFFDYVLLGKGDAKEVASKTGLDESILKEMRSEFEYFYPVDLRGSGKDLVQNHLTFFIYHHLAVWDNEKYWPRAIAVNGFVNIAGEKMSKSKGNIIPLRDLVTKKFSADLVRINIVTSAEDLDDADWRDENVNSFYSRMLNIYQITKKVAENVPKGEKTKIDDIVVNRLKKTYNDWLEHAEALRFRSAAQRSFFELYSTISRYVEYKGGIENANKETLKMLIEYFAKMNSPLIPHFAEEIWSMLGNKPFVFSKPIKDPGNVDKKTMMLEKMIDDLLSDVRKLIDLSRKNTKIYLYAFDDEDKEILEETQKYLARTFGFKEVKIYHKDEESVIDPMNKRQKAKKFKPAIYLE